MESISLLFKIFWSPGEALFKAAKSRKFLAPILLMMVSSVAFTVVQFKYVDGGQIALRVLEQRGTQLTQEQKDLILSRSNSTLSHVFGIVGAVVVPIVTTLILTTIFFGVFSIFGRDGGFKAFFAVTAWACIPLLLRQIVGAVMFITIPQSSLALDEIGGISPSIFLDRTGMSKSLFALVNSIDVVTIWVLILLAIGYRNVTTRSISPAVRYGCVFGVWLVWVGFRVALASFLPF